MYLLYDIRSEAGTDQGEQKGSEASGSDREHVLDPPNVPKVSTRLCHLAYTVFVSPERAI